MIQRRSRLRPISKKKLAQGQKYPSLSRSSIKRKTRKPSETLRIYGGKKRIEFVKSLPCAACGVVGFSENAHLTPKGEKGTGYKGDYQFIAPLCGSRAVVTSPTTGHTVLGCHKTYDRFRWEFDYDFPDFNPERAAADTESRWQEYQRATA